MSPTRTRTRSYDLRGRELRSGRRAEVEEDGDVEEREEEVEEREEEVEGAEEARTERRRSNRLKRRKSALDVYSDEEEGRVRFDLDESSDNPEVTEEEEVEEEETQRRRSERLSQTKHRSFVVPDDPMDDDRDDGDYVDEDDEEPRPSPRTNLRTRNSPRKYSEAEEEENEDSLSAAKLVKLAEKDASSILTRLIINEKVPLLILDESSTYSTLLAFAALRRSFEGLWCSRTDQTPFMPLKLPELLEENYDASIGKHRGCGYCRVGIEGAPKGRWYTTLKQSLTELSQGELARFDLNFWAHQLKGASSSPPIPTSTSTSTSTSPSSPSPISTQFPTKYIWLNPPSSPQLAGKESAYLKKFLFDCASIQPEGGCVFITLPRPGEIRLEDEQTETEGMEEELKMLGERLGYRCFVDECFVRDECVHNGFHTKEGKGVEGWATYVFVKVKTIEEIPMLDDSTKDVSTLPTALPRARTTIVMEVDSQPLISSPLPPVSSTAAADTALPTIVVARARASTPEPSQPTPRSTIPSPPPSPASSSVRRSSRQHGPLLYGTYRDVPLAEDGDGDMEEEVGEQQEGKEGKEKRQGSQGVKKARFWVDVPSSKASSSRTTLSTTKETATGSVMKKAGNKPPGKGQTTLEGTFTSQKRTTTARPKSKQTPTHTHSLSAPVSSPSSPPSSSASTLASTPKGKRKERERQREMVETTITISSMVIEMGKGYRVGGGVGGGGSRLGGEEKERDREKEEERGLSPEYLPPSPPVKRRRLAEEEIQEGDHGDGRDGEERMDVDVDVDPAEPESFPHDDVNAEEEAQARDFLNFQDEDEAMVQDDPPPPTSSREYQPLKRLKRASSFASGSGEGEGGGSVHSSHATLVPSPSTSPPAPPPPAVATASVDIDVDVDADVEVDVPGLRRSQRQREKETNIDRFNRNRGRSREEAIVVDTESDSADGDGGDDTSHDGHDSEDEDEHQNEEEQPPLLPLHRFVDIESRDAGLTYPNVHRYGTEYGQGQRWVELVDVELE